MKSLKEMPKIELHVHLDGSMRIDTASDLSNESIEAVKDKMVVSEHCDDLNDYLTKFSFPVFLLQTKENLSRVAHELGEDLKEDGVVYAEVRFAPILHIEKGLNLDEVVEAVLTGLKEVSIPTGLLLCLMRNSSFEDNLKVIELAKKYLGKGVVGVDLAGAEAMYPTEEFASLFEIVKKEGIPFTIHAGEASGKESIKSALSFGATRLGHGIRILESEELCKVVHDKKIVLEVCPTSNIQTKAVEVYSLHPIFLLYNKGLLVTVNTDNRTVSNITLTKEYQKLQATFNFSLDDFKKMNLDAIEASFLSINEKEELKQNYLNRFQEYITK